MTLASGVRSSQVAQKPGETTLMKLLLATAGSCSGLRDNENMAQAIVRDTEIMHGTPVFCGTRVPAQTLFDYIEGGEALEDFLEGFPTVSRELAVQALEEAKHLLARM